MSKINQIAAVVKPPSCPRVFKSLDDSVATLEDLGLATSMDNLDISIVRQWLKEQQAESVKYPDVAKAIASWVLQGAWDTPEKLSEQLWEQVDFPSYVSSL